MAAPVFVHHWADGDLLISSGTESTLLDVKTVIRADKVERTRLWLWQLLAYASLDVADRYRIRTVGLYLARHGVLITWPLPQLVDQLTAGTKDQAGLREDFRGLADRVMADGGARRPA